jgi:hypothetical protein
MSDGRTEWPSLRNASSTFVDNWLEGQLSLLFMVLPINIHEVWSAISGYFLQVRPYETSASLVLGQVKITKHNNF